MYTKQKIYLFFIILILSSLYGCTQKFKDVSDTVNATIESHKDVNLQANELEAIIYDSIYVSVNDGKRILMILAHIGINAENQTQQLKWLSGDKVLIVTENGRIVKTLAFENNNLAGISTNRDNISPSVKLNNWEATYDWLPGYRYQFTAKMKKIQIGQEKLSLSKWSLDTKHIIESIEFIELDTKINNHYWFNTDGKVVKTIQYIGPNMDKIEISFVKDFINKNH